MNNLIIALLFLCLICIFFIFVQMLKIKMKVDDDRMVCIINSYHKYYDVYKKACAIRKITPKEGISINEMQKVVYENIENE
jgi:hypothetical protein